MSESVCELFSIGEFSKKAGVTQRAIRFYDKIGLLKPSSYNEKGHRLYSKQDFARLQKILTLKFIGLSLDEICNIIKYDINDKDFKKSLEIQQKIMDDKINHMLMIKDAISETLNMVTNDKVLNWNKFINVINVINKDKSWIEQYENASNLRARINIHEIFSTNKYGWMKWFFEQLNIPKNSKILELGCGDGSLWKKNIDRIPAGWDITLTDFSPGMLNDAKKNLSKTSRIFKYEVVNAEDIIYDSSSFDVVIANNMLYHVFNLEKTFSEIKRVLRNNGYFFASTVGKNHMIEMRHILENYDSNLITTKSFDTTQNFQIENGYDMVSRWFSAVELKKYDDSLLVTEANPLIDYIFSTPGNLKEIFDNNRLKNLIDYINHEIKKTGGIHITKDTGYFKARNFK